MADPGPAVLLGLPTCPCPSPILFPLPTVAGGSSPEAIGAPFHLLEECKDRPSSLFETPSCNGSLATQGAAHLTGMPKAIPGQHWGCRVTLSAEWFLSGAPAAPEALAWGCLVGKHDFRPCRQLGPLRPRTFFSF